MKRKGNVLMSITLSLMLIYLGAGVMLMHCCHTERTTIVNVADCCKDDCKEPRKNCMQLEIRKLPPSVVSDYESAPLPLLKILANWPISVMECHVVPTCISQSLLTTNRWDGLPPRSYLSFLTVLLI